MEVVRRQLSPVFLLAQLFLPENMEYSIRTAFENRCCYRSCEFTRRAMEKPLTNMERNWKSRK